MFLEGLLHNVEGGQYVNALAFKTIWRKQILNTTKNCVVQGLLHPVPVHLGFPCTAVKLGEQGLLWECCLKKLSEPTYL